MLCCWSWLLVTTSLCILVCVSHTARYYAKFCLFIIVSLVSAMVPIPLMLLRPKDPRNALKPAWGLRQCASSLLGLRFELRGKENILREKSENKESRRGCVVLINHQSAIDLVVLAELWPIMPRCTVISKREVFWLGPFGLATWLWGKYYDYIF